MILHWAEREGRIVVTVDYNTMPFHLLQHLEEGRRSPGLICIRPAFRAREIVQELALVTHVGRDEDFADCVTYIPL